MKIEELCNQFDQMKEAFREASKEYNCDEVELVFKDDEGNFTAVNCIEGGYAPDQNTNLLIFSSGKNQLAEMLKKILGTPTINAEDIDIGAKLEEMFDDGDH